MDKLSQVESLFVYVPVSELNFLLAIEISLVNNLHH